ncbi:unnamed protein product [Orchesella dallaii]|uniref:Zonadhesin n=1 Tax=Orchesella dallaii TaxID=48710 RepID=A0ABP1QX07_9HEXA
MESQQKHTSTVILCAMHNGTIRQGLGERFRRRKAGESVFWQRLQHYVKHHGGLYEKTDIICGKCRGKVKSFCDKTGFRHINKEGEENPRPMASCTTGLTPASAMARRILRSKRQLNVADQQHSSLHACSTDQDLCQSQECPHPIEADPCLESFHLQGNSTESCFVNKSSNIDNKLLTLTSKPPILPNKSATLTSNPETLTSKPTLPNTSATLTSRPPTLTSNPTLPNNSAVLTSRPPTLTSKPTLPNTSATLSSRPPTLTSNPTLPNNSAALTSRPPTLTSNPTLPNNSAALTSRPPTLTSKPTLPNTSATLTSRPPTLTSNPTLPNNSAALTSRLPTLTSKPTLPNTSATLTSNPETLTSNPTLPNTSTTLTSKPPTLTSKPTLPNNSAAQTSKPPTLTSKPTTLPSKSVTLTSKPPTLTSKPSLPNKSATVTSNPPTSICNLLTNEPTTLLSNQDDQIEYETNNENSITIGGSQNPLENMVQTSYSQSTHMSNSEPIMGNKRKPCHARKSSSKRLQVESILSVGYTESKCFICGSSERKAVPQCAIFKLYLDEQIFVPSNNRTCSSHLNTIKEFTPEAVELIKTKAKPGASVSEWDVNSFFKKVIEQNKSKGPIINAETVTDEDCRAFFGLKKIDFDTLFSYIQQHLYKSALRSAKTALAIFLAKLRLGVSQDVLAKLFGVKNQPNVSKVIHRIAKLLEQHFVPQNLGVGHMSREVIENVHNPTFVRQMFEVPNENIVLILDGTYVYIEQASDHELQSATYSPHKHRNLVKFMMIVTPDGYIVDAPGPYLADSSNSDAKILSNMLKQEGGIASVLKANDHLILDRGFRDVVEALQRRGIK